MPLNGPDWLNRFCQLLAASMRRLGCLRLRRVVDEIGEEADEKDDH